LVHGHWIGSLLIEDNQFMKVLDLQCAHRHCFEGWFASEDDFQTQLSSGLVECPLCSDKSIQKMPSAPRLNLGGHATPRAAQPVVQGNAAQGSALGSATSPNQSALVPVTAASVSSLRNAPSFAEQAAFLTALRHVIKHTEDVGERFADEARRIHYGDAEARNIRGQASVREAVELMEEGIEVMPLPMPVALKETLQ
jgi:hypothetical protein